MTECTTSEHCGDVASPVGSVKRFCNFDNDHFGFCERCDNFPDPDNDCDGFINEKGMLECKRVCSRKYLQPSCIFLTLVFNSRNNIDIV